MISKDYRQAQNSTYNPSPLLGPLAQWLEQATHNRLVAGSNPAGATKFYLYGI